MNPEVRTTSGFISQLNSGFFMLAKMLANLKTDKYQ